MLRGVLFLFIVIIIKSLSYAGNTADMTSLHTTILTGYKTSVRPTSDYLTPTNISLYFKIINMMDVDEVAATIDINGFFGIEWTDDRLTWTPGSHGGIEWTKLRVSEIWKPFIMLGSSAGGKVYLHDFDNLVTVTYQGQVKWYPGDTFKSACVFDIRKYPFDLHTCTLYFLTWGSLTSELTLIETQAVMNNDMYVENAQWDVISKSGQLDVMNGIPQYNIAFVIQRRSKFCVINLLLPMVLVTLGNVFVFLLPPDSGERVGFSITFLLSISVFLSIVSDTLPQISSPDIPIISYLLFLMLLTSILIMVGVIASLRMHLSKDDEQVPMWLIKLQKCLRCRKTEKQIYSNKVRVTPRNEKELTQVNGLGQTSSNEFDDDEDIKWTDIANTFDRHCFYMFFSIIMVCCVIVMLVLMM